MYTKNYISTQSTGKFVTRNTLITKIGFYTGSRYLNQWKWKYVSKSIVQLFRKPDVPSSIEAIKLGWLMKDVSGSTLLKWVSRKRLIAQIFPNSLL